MIDPKIKAFLKLTSSEVRLYSHLREKPSSQISQVSKDLKMPRASVYLVLKTLKERGLIDYKHKGKRKFWSVVETSKLISQIMTAASVLGDAKEIRIDANNSGFAVHQGTEAMYKVWKDLEKLAPYSRVQGIQPTAILKYAFGRGKWQEKIQPLQEHILKKPIIIEGVLPEDYYSFVAKYYSDDKKLQKQVLESFLGRSTDITFISDTYFKNAESELLILPHTAYLSDWKNEVSVEIKNPSMLLFLRELYELAKGYGRKVNQEEYIKKLVEKLD